MTDDVPQIFDRPLYIARQLKASGTEILQTHVTGELGDRLALIMRRLPTALIISFKSPILRSSLEASGKFDTLEWVVPSAVEDLQLPDQKYDCIINLMDLHCINDVPGHLSQMGRSLKADGLLLVAFFAGETLHELRDSWLNAEIEITGGVSPRVAPMIGIRELGSLMQRAGLALPVADMEKTTVRYADVFALMRDIKAFGFSNPLTGRSSRFVSRRCLTKVAQHYHAHNTHEDGRIHATLEIAWALAWTPHESQQKPLKPGTAKQKLAKALSEIRSDED